MYLIYHHVIIVVELVLIFISLLVARKKMGWSLDYECVVCMRAENHFGNETCMSFRLILLDAMIESESVGATTIIIILLNCLILWTTWQCSQTKLSRIKLNILSNCFGKIDWLFRLLSWLSMQMKWNLSTFGKWQMANTIFKGNWKSAIASGC